MVNSSWTKGPHRGTMVEAEPTALVYPALRPQRRCRRSAGPQVQAPLPGQRCQFPARKKTTCCSSGLWRGLVPSPSPPSRTRIPTPRSPLRLPTWVPPPLPSPLEGPMWPPPSPLSSGVPMLGPLPLPPSGCHVGPAASPLRGPMWVPPPLPSGFPM
eukprot:jgi/Botrbrau1/22223/Bobra.168_1s0054.1